MVATSCWTRREKSSLAGRSGSRREDRLPIIRTIQRTHLVPGAVAKTAADARTVNSSLQETHHASIAGSAWLVACRVVDQLVVRHCRTSGRAGGCHSGFGQCGAAIEGAAGGVGKARRLCERGAAGS